MNSEPEWNVSEEKTDAYMLGLIRSEKRDSRTLIEKYREEKNKRERLEELLSEQWQQNYFIKNKNIELEDKIQELNKIIQSFSSNKKHNNT